MREHADLGGNWEFELDADETGLESRWQLRPRLNRVAFRKQIPISSKSQSAQAETIRMDAECFWIQIANTLNP